MSRRRRRPPTNAPLLDDDGCFRVSWWPARWRNRGQKLAPLEVEEVDAVELDRLKGEHTDFHAEQGEDA